MKCSAAVQQAIYFFFLPEKEAHLREKYRRATSVVRSRSTAAELVPSPQHSPHLSRADVVPSCAVSETSAASVTVAADERCSSRRDARIRNGDAWARGSWVGLLLGTGVNFFRCLEPSTLLAQQVGAVAATGALHQLHSRYSGSENTVKIRAVMTITAP